MTTVHEETISELERQIRDFINQARRQHALLKDSGAWNQLCSSLDVIGDTELAFDAYDEAPDTDDAGGDVHFGFMACFRHWCSSRTPSGIWPRFWAWPMNPTRSSLEVREVRNASAGHPTKRHGRARSHFISRISMTKTGFQLLTVHPDHAPAEFKGVSLPALISTQRSQLRAVLKEVVASLQKEESEHRAMFKGEKLASAFPDHDGLLFREDLRINSRQRFPRVRVGSMSSC